MAETNEILRSRHVFGDRKNVAEALANGKIDEYDILFLTDGDGYRVGWITKEGQPVFIGDDKEIVVLKELPDAATNPGKEGIIYVYGASIYVWNGENYVTSECEGVSEEVVNTKIETALTSANTYADTKLTEANQYVDEKIEVIESTLETTLANYSTEEYEVSYKPESTLVDYRDKEIRIMCPANTVFELQNSGAGSDPNAYYIGLKAYAPNDNVVSFKEDLAEIIADATMYDFEGEFAGIDEDGRKYSIVWLPVARYDTETSTWTYYGASSSGEKYIGWYYSVEWYNAEGKVIASDCIRVNLSNESCHTNIKPYYITTSEDKMTKYVDDQIALACEIVEI